MSRHDIGQAQQRFANPRRIVHQIFGQQIGEFVEPISDGKQAGYGLPRQRAGRLNLQPQSRLRQRQFHLLGHHRRLCCAAGDSRVARRIR